MATEVDHVQHGDNHDLANLQAVCSDCHSRKSAAEGVTARTKHSRKRPTGPHPGLR